MKLSKELKKAINIRKETYLNDLTTITRNIEALKRKQTIITQEYEREYLELIRKEN